MKFMQFLHLDEGKRAFENGQDSFRAERWGDKIIFP